MSIENTDPSAADPMSKGGRLLARTTRSIAEVDAEAWDACANPDPGRTNPFVLHAFLKALEVSGTVGQRTGWSPLHVLLEDGGGQLAGAAACYLKSHSQGEYVFDYAWADAYRRAGGQYYPKLLVAVPFTPVPGPRLMVRPTVDDNDMEAMLGLALTEVGKQSGVSSLHVTFLERAAAERLTGLGYLLRTGQQFHWSNSGYGSFDDFLATFASRKRKAVRKEREQAVSGGIEIELVTGAAIKEAHWDAMYAFYSDTGNRKWGQPYLNRQFFSLLGEAMPDRCLLILAKRNRRYIAGALNLIGGECLYGRYWGAIEHHPCLHFELCYYQAIDFSIARKLARAEAGAQGEHKLARGYLPVETYSVHWIRDRGFRDAVSRFLMAEREAIKEAVAEYGALAPYRRSVATDPRAEDHD